MKCVRSKISNKIIRVTNERATILVENSGTWEYVSKSEWKEQKRKGKS